MNRAYRQSCWAFAGVVVLCAGISSAQMSTSNSETTARSNVAAAPRLEPGYAAQDRAKPHSDRADADSVINGPQVTLQELVELALAQNPSIKSALEHYEARRTRTPQARSLPDPMVSGGWMGNIRPFSVQHGDPSSYRGVTAEQDFPFPGKLKLRGKIADREAEASRWDAEQTRRMVVSDVKVAYYDYFYETKAIEITQKDKSLLKKLESITEARYRVGKGIQQDVLRAQIEVSRIDQKLIVLQQQQQTAQARINTLLNRSAETPLPPPAPLVAAEFGTSLEQLYALARSNDPLIQRDQSMIEGDRYSVALAQKAYEPDFRVSYAYQQRPAKPDMNGAMFGINVPIFYRTKQREGVIEASHDLISSTRDLDQRQIAVEFEMKREYLAAIASRDLMNLYSKAIVPQSSLALESSMSSYEVGKVDFLSMLDNFVYVLDYEVGYYQELSNFQSALARLEPLVSMDLTQ